LSNLFYAFDIYAQTNSFCFGKDKWNVMKLFLGVLANIMGHGETKGKEMYWDHVLPLKRESVCVCVREREREAYT
jgi:hypothetical protein